MKSRLQDYAMQLGSKKKTILLEYDFILLQIMQKYSWSWEDIKNMPESMLELAIGKLNLDNKS